jgi:hypothetical protein
MARDFAESSTFEWHIINADASNMFKTYSYGVGELCA